MYITICLKMIDHGSRSTWGPGPSGSGFRAQKYDAPTKTDLPYNFCFIKIFLSLVVAAVDALQTLFRAPLTPGVHPGGRNIAYDLALVKLGPHTKSLDSDRQTDNLTNIYKISQNYYLT